MFWFLGFSTDELAVAIAYWSFLSCFAWKLAAFKAEFNAFGVRAVADLAKLVFSRNATFWTCRANSFLHFWASLTCYAANTNFHCYHSTKDTSSGANK
jgi:hypothetical protein